MLKTKYFANGLIGASALLVAATRALPAVELHGSATSAALVTAVDSASSTVTLAAEPAKGSVLANTKAALSAFSSAVRPLSHPKALETAFRAYYAFLAEKPGQVAKPYLYFVDYGQASTRPRGYVFDMRALKIVDGPFTVAHGRGSGPRYGVPTRFTNTHGSATSSLGLYVARNTYAFSGKSGGGRYSSIGLRLQGVSGRYNNRALARGVVAHGAPYVTASSAGRSEGCPAMEQQRARRLLPKLANGGMVFLFAPNANWMSNDPWVSAGA